MKPRKLKLTLQRSGHPRSSFGIVSALLVGVGISVSSVLPQTLTRESNFEDYALIEAYVDGVPVYSLGNIAYIYGLSPDLMPGAVMQQGNNNPVIKIKPKKSWEIKSNSFGVTIGEPGVRSMWNDSQPMLPIHLIDGDSDTAWCSYGSAVPDARPEWIRIDLPRESRVSSVALVCSTDFALAKLWREGKLTDLMGYHEWAGRALPNELSIQVSRDAWHWKTVYDNKDFSGNEEGITGALLRQELPHGAAYPCELADGKRYAVEIVLPRHSQERNTSDDSVGDERPTAARAHELDTGAREYGVWGGGSFESPTVFAGEIEKRTLLLFGLRYGRVLWTNDSLAIAHTIDIPAAVVLQPKVKSLSGNGYAAGVSPLGVKLNFGRRNRVQPFVSWSGGFLYSTSRLPIVEDTRFKFTADVSLGLQFFNQSRAFVVGYKYYHISNGRGLARENPGIDSHMLYIGLSFFK